MNRHLHHRLLAATAVSALLGTGLVGLSVSTASTAGGHHHPGHVRFEPTPRALTALDGPRGVDALGGGRTLVTESDGSFSLVVERRHRRSPLVVPLGSVSPGFAPAVAAGHHGNVYVLTGAGEPGTGAATLYRWRRGYDEPVPVADIAAYQATDPDPDDLEDLPEDSNPFGLAVLRDGSVLVADAAGNDLLRVRRDGSITTVARLRPRTVEVPDGLPPTDPEGNPLPPAGTPIPSEAVATSVAVGKDGAIYVGELRGFPATPGTSQVWRIRPGATDATCDPASPDTGDCTLWTDGLTSVVDLAVGAHGVVYALSLSTLSWLAVELGTPGAEIGSLHAIAPTRAGRTVRELVAGQLVNPGGVDATRDALYLTGPVFGPGSLSKLSAARGHRHPHRR